jgi:predicted RNA binding protein YcfA (HicA-like mRNA interferase family)
VKIPRDLSGEELARALRRYGYEITRQSGSHMRLSSSFHGIQHHVTIPAHSPLKIGTLSQILGDVAGYLELTRDQLIEKLFS